MAGRNDDKRKGRGRNRSDDLHNYWRKKQRPLKHHNYVWKVTCYRGDLKRKRRAVRLDPILTSLSWEDEVIQRATMVLHNPDKDERLQIKEGYKLRVHYAREQGGKWKRLWTLRITTVSQSASGDMTIEAADELEWLKRSKDDFIYKKGDKKSRHKRPGGWYGHDIVKDVCRRYGIKVGRLAKCDHKIENLSEEGVSPFEIITKAYEKERDETGKRFVIRMKEGKLFVTTMRRPRDLLILGGQMMSAEITRSMPADMATHLTVRASVKREAGEHKKIDVKVKATRKIRRRLGHIHNFWELEDPVDSRAKVRKRAQREMKDRMEPKREVTISLQGDVNFRRGDAVKIKLPTEGLRELLYVKTVSHSVSGSDYTMDATLSFSDYYEDKEGDKTREQICRKARENGRRGPKYCRKGRVRGDYDPAAPSGGGRRRNRRNRNRDRENA